MSKHVRWDCVWACAKRLMKVCSELCVENEVIISVNSKVHMNLTKENIKNMQKAEYSHILSSLMLQNAARIAPESF